MRLQADKRKLRIPFDCLGHHVCDETCVKKVHDVWIQAEHCSKGTVCFESIICSRCNKCFHHCECFDHTEVAAKHVRYNPRKDTRQLALCEKPDLHLK